MKLAVPDDPLPIIICFLYVKLKTIWVAPMVTIKDLIEDWIVMRSTLVRQLERFPCVMNRWGIPESAVF